ncbi:MAG: ABC transporter permease subunit [Caldilineales bacterium]|nr:ABC transporter permease subunit [Caldilineales bacterium]MCW5857007.1 ABC transporter permease subunit [Caldilineales bacterium]
MTSTHLGPTTRRILRKLADTAIILLAVVFLALFGLIMAERGRERVPAPPLEVAGQALVRTADYVLNHPQTYFFQRNEQPALELVSVAFLRSAGLLVVALVVAALLGIGLGLAMALSRRRIGSTVMLAISVIGISTPSFLLAMFLWVINIQIYRRFAVSALPSAGFGWDLHMVMPVIVLAVRPLAQLAQVTYVSMSEVLAQDYIRTARAKGLSARQVVIGHVTPNILLPVLTTLGTSLRFSLAALPVVEYFFDWPGVGWLLLEAIRLGMTTLAIDLVVALGLFFLIVNLLLDLLYPILDPRLRGEAALQVGYQAASVSPRQSLAGLGQALRDRWRDWQDRRDPAAAKKPGLPPLPAPPTVVDQTLPVSGASRIFRSLIHNPILQFSTVLIIAFAALAVFGDGLTAANPYEMHGLMLIDGKSGTPPFPPSRVFAWGSDHVGRDVRALVLSGGRQTLTLALFGMIARVLLGAALGLVAGWWQGGRFDRLVTGVIGVWAAFPATIFAMILIQGLGIQQGMWVFIVAICLVGWGEVTQFVRSQVIKLRPEPYVEAARALGAGTPRLLTQHLLPHLLSPLLVLAVLEMGGVLLLLAELGFLNTFLGGGFRVEIAEAGNMVPVIAYVSDVPEWGAMLANIRLWWRSYPWMAWYPGLAFFLAIFAFNLWGEGLRRFLNDSRINISRLINRYSFVALAVAAVALVWFLRAATPMGVYASSAGAFDAEAAQSHVQVLAGPAMEGRETGTPGAEKAAQYIAQQMEEIGLFPAGDDNTFLQTAIVSRSHLVETPRLVLLDDQGNVAEALVYRQDFVESTATFQVPGQGAIVGVAVGPDPDTPGADPYRLGNSDLFDKVIVVADAGDKRINVRAAAGVLFVSDDPMVFERKELFATLQPGRTNWRPTPPVMYITPQTADRLLATAGSSLAELRQMAAGLERGEVAMTAAGVTVDLETSVVEDETLQEKYFNVIGFIPGSGAAMRDAGGSLDQQVIMVSAYYDGLGVGPDGTLYPGANDNASGVAVMLEMARALKQSPYEPKKTVVFVAWTGGERSEALSLINVMNAKRGFSSLKMEAVIELSGVGAGDGQAIALGEGSSYRLVKLFQQAAGRTAAAITTRGRGPHYDRPAAIAFGGRDAMTMYVSWDGSDGTAHTPRDTFAAIDPDKLRQVGETTLLTLTALARETDY